MMNVLSFHKVGAIAVLTIFGIDFTKVGRRFSVSRSQS